MGYFTLHVYVYIMRVHIVNAILISLMSDSKAATGYLWNIEVQTMFPGDTSNSNLDELEEADTPWDTLPLW